MARPSHNGWPAVTPSGAWGRRSGRRWGGGAGGGVVGGGGVGRGGGGGKGGGRGRRGGGGIGVGAWRQSGAGQAARVRPPALRGGRLCVEPSRQQFGQAGHA